MDKLLRQHRDKINAAIFECICDKKLSLGQTLTVLKQVQTWLDEQVANHEKSIIEKTNGE